MGDETVRRIHRRRPVPVVRIDIQLHEPMQWIHTTNGTCNECCCICAIASSTFCLSFVVVFVNQSRIAHTTQCGHACSCLWNEFPCRPPSGIGILPCHTDACIDYVAGSVFNGLITLGVGEFTKWVLGILFVCHCYCNCIYGCVCFCVVASLAIIVSWVILRCHLRQNRPTFAPSLSHHRGVTR